MHKLCTWLGQLLLSLTIALAFGYGFYGLFTYALPLSKGHFRQAMTSCLADETEVLINGAAKAYEDGRLEEATKVLEVTLEKLVDKGGHYKRSNHWKLERVYFLLGKCYHLQEQYDKAIQNYEDTLRLNAGHMPAKYNLEMIQRMGGDGGGKKMPPNKKLQPKL